MELYQSSSDISPPSPAILCQFQMTAGDGAKIVTLKGGSLNDSPRLDLTVGNHGIVGRPVYIKASCGKILGDGIIGWN